MRFVLLTSVARLGITRPEASLSRAVLLNIDWRIVAMQWYEGMREYFSRVREAFVVKVVKIGKQGVKQGEMPLEIGTHVRMK